MGNILAVDDSEPMRKMVELVLKSGGHQVTLANDGVEALQKFQASKFDLIVTDINMPEMNGIELIKAVRAQHSDIPIVALTTESDDALRKKGAEAGADGWVVKPFKPAQFLDIIRQILG
jgi:two-component system chemotaxis response regulator CheY